MKRCEMCRRLFDPAWIVWSSGLCLGCEHSDDPSEETAF
jgi:hypothetical protein